MDTRESAVIVACVAMSLAGGVGGTEVSVRFETLSGVRSVHPK